MFWDYVETSSEAQISVDSDMYNDWCLPHFYDDCSPTSTPRASNLLFGCVSAATVLKNAFVLVQVNRFQQIIGVYTLQAPSYGNKVRTTTLYELRHVVGSIFRVSAPARDANKPVYRSL